MTNEQKDAIRWARDVAIAGKWEHVKALQELLAAGASEGQAEPIYMVRFNDEPYVWEQVSNKELFNKTEPGDRCVMFAAPSASIADTAGASDLESLLADITAIDTWHRGSPTYEHDAGWFKSRVVRLLEERIAAPPAPSVASTAKPVQVIPQGVMGIPPNPPGSASMTIRHDVLTRNGGIADTTGAKAAQPISDAMMDLVDRLGSEADAVDPRAWAHLLAYARPHMTLDKPAQVSRTRFGTGAKWSTVIGAAQRCYEFMQTPEKEAMRVENARSFIESLAAPSAPSVADAAGAGFLKICSEERTRGSLTSLPLKLEFAKERGMTLEQVHEWMRDTHRMFCAAVDARLKKETGNDL